MRRDVEGEPVGHVHHVVRRDARRVLRGERLVADADLQVVERR